MEFSTERYLFNQSRARLLTCAQLILTSLYGEQVYLRDFDLSLTMASVNEVKGIWRANMRGHLYSLEERHWNGDEFTLLFWPDGLVDVREPIPFRLTCRGLIYISSYDWLNPKNRVDLVNCPLEGKVSGKN